MRRLVSGLCAAVDQALPGTAQSARSALDNGVPDVAAVGMLLGALEGRPLALVLDDFQHLDDLPVATALFDHFLRFRPQTLKLVLLSRTPPLPTSIALAGTDRVCTLNHCDLRFNAAEAIELLQAHGIGAALATQLATHANGWAVGLLLFARAAMHNEPIVQLDALMGYLGTEILATLSPDLRAFLLESAALGPIAADATDAILGRCDSAARFAEAAARGLFLDIEDNLYHYHDLFAEYLVNVLQNETPQRLSTIRQTAVDWWTTQGDLPRALGILAWAGEWKELADRLDQELASLWSQGMWGTILAHVERLPPSYRSPRLLTYCGHVRSQRGEFSDALALADQGMAAATGDKDWLGATVLRAETLVLAGRYEEGLRSADAALPVARKIQHLRAEARLHEIRGMAWLRFGRFEDGHACLLEALAMHVASGDEESEALTLYNLATHLIEAGHSHQVEGYLTRAGALWRRTSNDRMLGNVFNSRAMLRALTGDLEAAREEAAHAISLAHETGHPILECAASATLAEICADEGDAVEAERLAQSSAMLAARMDIADALNDALRARIAAALLRRDRSGSRRLLDEARPLVLTPVDNALLDLAEGMLALRSRAFSRASQALGTVAEQLEQVGRPHHAARAYLLYAEALLATGVSRRADDALNRMAELVLPLGCEGFLRPTARLARQVFSERHKLRRLRRETRLLLDRLAPHGRSLSLVVPDAEDVPELPTLCLTPFGQGGITLAGRQLDASLPPKARELLFYTVHAGRPVQRDELLESIWEDDQRAAQSLWDASRHLRRVLGEQAWGPSGGAYALHLPVQNDERAFEEAAATALGDDPVSERIAAAERALGLIGEGGYLEWCDSLWASAARARLTQRATQVALALARLQAQAGAHQEAIAACRRAVVLDPLDEAPRQALLRQLAASGDVAAVRREYAAYRRLLHEELAVAPSAGLQRLAHELHAVS